MIWYFVEASLIVIAASGPALKPFFRRYVPAFIGCSRGNHRDSGSYAIGESHDTQWFQISTRVSAEPRTRYSEGDSIINEELGIMKTTEVVLTVESILGPQDRGNGRWASRTP